MNLKEKISKRQHANREILKILSDTVEKYPDWRFGQLLYNVHAIKNDGHCLRGTVLDPYHVESVDMLDDIVTQYLGITKEDTKF